jgi:hypothetical protein
MAPGEGDSAIQLRADRSKAFMDAAAITAFAILTSVTALFHEPWADEAQAWLVARDSGFWTMMTERMSYEGSPGLWHALLWPLAHAHLPYWSMECLAVAIAIVATALFVKLSPFPRWIRLLLPFTMLFSYQFAVVARSYVLDVPLTFLALYLIRRRPTKIIWIAAVLGLMANTNFFALFLSAALGGVYLFDAWRIHSLFGARRNQTVAALAVYALLSLVAVKTAMPPRDIETSRSRLGYILHTNAGASVPRPHVGDPGKPPQVLGVLFLCADQLGGSIIVGLIFAVGFGWFLVARRRVIAALPVLAILAAFLLGRVFAHHLGLFMLAVIASLWLAWPEESRPVRSYSRAELCGTLLLTLYCLHTILWTARAVAFDIRYPYDGSRACAEYIRKNLPGGRVFGYNYWSVAVEPYFDRKLFANQPASYWVFSVLNTVNLDLNRLQRERPDAVVLSWIMYPGNNRRLPDSLSLPVGVPENAIIAAGYHPVATFSGTHPLNGATEETDYLRVFRPAGSK